MKNKKFSLEKKIVVVIGGTGLIGKSLVKGYLDAGAFVCVGSRKNKKSNKQNLLYEKIDITNEYSIENFIEKIVKKYKKIDVWVNCAYPKTKYSDVSVEKIKINEMKEDINNHLLGYFNCCRKALEIMKKNKQGSIINFGSIYGEIMPDFSIYKDTEIKKDPTYFLIKSGIHAMSKYFAVLGANYNTRVNTIAPGGVFDNHSEKFVKQYSERVPMKKMAKPADIIGIGVFLASNASNYITGQTIFIDGGISIW